MKEFDLIKAYFSQQNLSRKDVLLTIGDDCAVVKPTANQHIAITTDTLVKGVHFPDETPAKAIGHKAIAVNLSDLAAMGAEPSWISLAITLPSIDENWVKAFCEGVFELCNLHNVQLIGGDTTQGPMSITVTAQGLIPEGQQLTRSGAQNGDYLYVTGEIGDAALALQHYYKQINLPESVLNKVQPALDLPSPRVEIGKLLREYATSAIDISDGLLADLTHICNASHLGAEILLDKLPVSKELIQTLGHLNAAKLALVGGDDYELLFSVSAENKANIEKLMTQANYKVTCIGVMNSSKTISTTFNGEFVSMVDKGYEHFSNDV